MRRLIFAISMVAVLALSSSFTPSAMALPPMTVTDYYDSGMNNIGTAVRDCAGQYQSWGTLCGEWKEVEWINCLTGERFYTDYQYCSGAWVQVGTLGDSVCSDQSSC
jgi:hypothetical protein